MYFKEKTETNIDKDFGRKKSEYKNTNSSSKFNTNFLVKIIIAIFIIGIAAVLLTSKNTKYNLLLKGSNPMIIYMDSEYIEPGFEAKDSKGQNLENQVVVSSNLDTKVIGKYQIVYKLR